MDSTQIRSFYMANARFLLVSALKNLTWPLNQDVRPKCQLSLSFTLPLCPHLLAWLKG